MNFDINIGTTKILIMGLSIITIDYHEDLAKIISIYIYD